MKIKFSLFLSLAFLIISTITILILSLYINVSLKQQFKTFAIERQENQRLDLVEELSVQWEPVEGWSADVLERFGMKALEKGFILRIYNPDGSAVWDTSLYDDTACMMKKNEVCADMAPYMDDDAESFEVWEKSVFRDKEFIGYVELVSFSPFYFAQEDLEFISSINRQLLIAAVLSGIAAVLTALLLSLIISRPILAAGDFARTIADGNFTNIECSNLSPAEVQSLFSSINHVSRSLEAQQKLRNQMSADVAHEIRTPLATLQSHVEAMIDGVWPADEEHLECTHQEILRLTRLVSELSTLSAYETDFLQLDNKPIKLEALVSEIIKMNEPTLNEKGIEFKTKIPDIKLYGDEDKIKQVIINLLSNSMKHTPAGGNIIISANQTSDDTFLTVSDSGTGIPREDLPFIFERFYRVDKSRNRISGGSGIGLTIVKEIIKAHGGQIKVESEPGVKTEVIITIPRENKESKNG